MRHSNGLPAGGATFKHVPMGAGGQIIQFSQSTDGATKTICADIHGAYVMGASDNVWRQLFLSTAIPGACVTADHTWTNSSSGTPYNDHSGCADCVVAPSSASTIYMIYDGYLLKSTDTGNTFSQTNATRLQWICNGYNAKNWGHGLTADPNNASVLLYGTQGHSVFYTTDGGTTFTDLTVSRPFNSPGDSNAAVHLTACDPTSTQTGGIRQGWFYTKYFPAAPVQSNTTTATTGGTLAAGTYYYVVTATCNSGATETLASNEKSQVTTGSTSTVTISWSAVSGASGYKVYRGTSAGLENVYFAPGNVTTFTDTGGAGTAGTPPTSTGAGVYHSTTGPGGTYSLMSTTGMPTSPSSLFCDAGGTLWVTQYGVTNNVWKWTSGGGWVNVNIDSGHSFGHVAVDPANTLHVIAHAGGRYYLSTDGGNTWPSVWADDLSLTPGSAGSQTLHEKSVKYMDVGWAKCCFPTANQIHFDKATAGLLWAAHGWGIASATIPASSSTALSWTSIGEGTEELVCHTLCAIPGGKRLLGAWDMGSFDVQSLTRFTNLQMSAYLGTETWAGATEQPFIQQPCASFDYAADNANWVVALQHGGWYSVSQSAPHIWYSTDGGNTRQQFATPPPRRPSNAGGGTLAVGTAGNVVIVWNANQTPVYTKDGGNTWSDVPIPGLAPSGTENGFGFDGTGYFYNRPVITYDKAGGYFYLFNYGAPGYTSLRGIWRSTNGDSWTQVYTLIPTTNGGAGSCHLRSVPGQAGHLFFCGGPGVSNSLMRSTDGTGAVWSAVTTNSGQTVNYVTDIGFGKAAPGKSYPTMFFWGAVNGVFAVWRTDDNFTTCVNLSGAPANSLDYPMQVVGDPDVYGRVWLCMSGNGLIVGDYSFAETVS